MNDDRLDDVYSWSTGYMNQRKKTRDMEIYWWTQNVYPTSYERFIFDGALKDGSLTPALQIFHEWQKGKTKSWKWNSMHRHKSEEQRVSWSDNRSFDDPPIALSICGMFSKRQKLNIAFGRCRDWIKASREEQNAFWVIKSVFKRIWDAKARTKHKKRLWWNLNVSSASPLVAYNWYRQCLEPADEFTKLCLEVGITFRHCRRDGYIPYVQEAHNLEEEFTRLRSEVFRLAEIRGIDADEGSLIVHQFHFV